MIDGLQVGIISCSGLSGSSGRSPCAGRQIDPTAISHSADAEFYLFQPSTSLGTRRPARNARALAGVGSSHVATPCSSRRSGCSGPWWRGPSQAPGGHGGRHGTNSYPHCGGYSPLRHGIKPDIGGILPRKRMKMGRPVSRVLYPRAKAVYGPEAFIPLFRGR